MTVRPAARSTRGIDINSQFGVALTNGRDVTRIPHREPFDALLNTRAASDVTQIIEPSRKPLGPCAPRSSIQLQPHRYIPSTFRIQAHLDSKERDATAAASQITVVAGEVVFS